MKTATTFRLNDCPILLLSIDAAADAAKARYMRTGAEAEVRDEKKNLVWELKNWG